jgi:phthalate 4,5-cis-dihydrodiol dehydrogenase
MQPDSNSGRLLEFALVGCGNHSTEIIIPALSSMHDVHCLWVSDPNLSAAQRSSRSLGKCAFFSDWAEGFKFKKPDAVLGIATPQEHFAVASHALDQGIPVFVEKPPTTDIAGIRRLAEIAQRLNVPTMVGHNLRHSEAALNMRASLSKLHTDAFAVHVKYLASKPRGDRWELGSQLQAFCLSHLIHAIDYFFFITDNRAMSVECALLSEQAEGISLSVLLRLSNGGVGSILASNLSPHFDFSADVLGGEQIHIRQSGMRSIEIFDATLDKRWGNMWVSKTLQAGWPDTAGYQRELDLFFQAVRTKNSNICAPSFRDEVRVFEVLRAISDRLTAG